MEAAIILTWFVLTFVVANVGSKREIGFWPSFFASLFLSPIIGLIIVIISNKKKNVKARFNDSIEKAKMSEFKGNIGESIDHYMNALFYLENDFKHVKESKTIKEQRMISIENLNKKIAKLKVQQSSEN